MQFNITVGMDIRDELMFRKKHKNDLTDVESCILSLINNEFEHYCEIIQENQRTAGDAINLDSTLELNSEDVSAIIDSALTVPEIFGSEFTQEFVSKQWPSFTYKGRDIIQLACDMDSEMRPPHEARECFMGYISDRDQFVMGWDCWVKPPVEYKLDDDEDCRVYGYYKVIRVNDDGSFHEIDADRIPNEFYQGALETIVNKYPQIIGYRYD